MPAPVYYLSAIAAGTGDGSSYANRASWSWEKYLGKLAEFSTKLISLADTDEFFTTKYNDIDGTELTTTGFAVITGGTANGLPGSATNPVMPGVYIDDVLVPHYFFVPARIGLRIRLCGADGPVSTTNNPGDTSTFTDAHNAPGGAGTDTSPIIVFVTESDDPLNPGQPIPDTPLTVETVSTTIAHKSGVNTDWLNPANYSSDTGWTGTNVDRAVSWPVERPRIGFTFIGTRAPDPRTDAQKATQIRITYRDNQMVYDPARTSSTNPVILKSDGSSQPFVLDRGERFDLGTRTIIAATSDALGNYWNRTPPSYHVFRGIQWKQYAAPFDYANAKASKFIHFRACKSHTTRYWNARGPAVTDVWAERMENDGWSAKCHTPETNCYRWLFRHVWQRGRLYSGDHIKAGFQSSQPWDAGPLIIENMFGDAYWDSNTVQRDADGKVINHGTSNGGTKTQYPQGEGVDYEGNNLVMRRVKLDLALDGAIDTKARTGWIGYTKLFLENCVFSRTRRSMRIWYSSGTYDNAQLRYNAAVLKNVTVQDSVDRALHIPTTSAAHNIVIWRNDDGRAMCDKNRAFGTKTYYFRLTEADDAGGSAGNSTVVAFQPLDLRPSGSPALKHRGNDERPLPTAPLASGETFRTLTRVTRQPPPNSSTYRQLSVDGVRHSPDTSSKVGGTVKLTVPTPAAWTTAGGGELIIATNLTSAAYTPPTTAV